MIKVLKLKNLNTMRKVYVIGCPSDFSLNVEGVFFTYEDAQMAADKLKESDKCTRVIEATLLIIE